jgi:hypothetical protein
MLRSARNARLEAPAALAFETALATEYVTIIGAGRASSG